MAVDWTLAFLENRDDEKVTVPRCEACWESRLCLSKQASDVHLVFFWEMHCISWVSIQVKLRSNTMWKTVCLGHQGILSRKLAQRKCIRFSPPRFDELSDVSMKKLELKFK